MMPEFKTMKYWFYVESDGKYIVVDPTTDSMLAKIVRLDYDSDSVTGDLVISGKRYVVSKQELVGPDLEEAFTQFMNRPEYIVGQSILIPAEITSDELSILSLYYNRLLMGVLLKRYKAKAPAGSDPDAIFPRLDAMMQWLEGNKFYHSPASTRFHESFRGGLLVHCLKVYNQILNLQKHQLILLEMV